ncbi:MAG: hypothetical protein HY547_04570 [Elusimicrobia bacterium]|nr:hypothetical protein [Elusimicrobiota bacterium]
MRYFYFTGFKKSFQNLPIERRKRVEEALERFALALEESRVAAGLGLKQLHHGFWEIRSGISDRIIFHKEKDAIEFILCGTHEDVKRFLKRL